MGKKRNAYRLLVGKRPLGSQSRGRIILSWILEIEDGSGVDWIDLAQDRDNWRAIVNVVMNLWVP
jgi:hypothetical protein